MQLNPSYGPPYEHLIELLLGERGDSARAVQVNSAYQRLAPDADHREWGPLSLALAFGSPTARARAMSAIDTLPLPVVMQLAHYLNQPRFRRSQEQLFGVVARRVTEQDVVLHPFVAAARIALGQLSGAVASALESDGCRGNAIYFAYLIVRAPLPPEAEAALQASRSRVNSCPGGSDVFLSGAYAADVGRWAAVDSTRAFLAALARRQLGIGDSLKARHTRLLAEALHGYQVARAGDVEQGIRMLQSLQPQLRGSAVVRWWLGELLLENGRPREARVYFASYWGDKEGIPASYFLARIDEQLGNRAQARAEYARFADGWRNADREVQPYVAEARARIAALDKRVH